MFQITITIIGLPCHLSESSYIKLDGYVLFLELYFDTPIVYYLLRSNLNFFLIVDI